MKRHLYIQKEFQSRVMLNFCLLVLSGTFLFCLAYYYSLNVKLDGNYPDTLDKVRYIKNAFMNRFFLLELAVFVFLGVGVVVQTLLMSHRIAGPLWRIEQTAKAVGGGDMTVKIRLREKDELRGLADQMNRMVDTVGTRLKEVGDAVSALDGKVELLRKHMSDAGAPHEETIRLLTDIRQTSKELVDKLPQA